MDNFNLRKYLAENKLLEDSQSHISQYLIDKEEIKAEPDDDPGDFSAATVWKYEIPKNDDYYGGETEDEFYNNMLEIFGRGYNGAPGSLFTRVSYKIEDKGDMWYLEVTEVEAYDI